MFNQTAIANAYCHHSSDAVCIPIEISKIIVNINDQNILNFWKAVTPQIIRLKHLEFAKLSNWTFGDIIFLLEVSNLASVKKGDQVDVSKGFILLQGQLTYSLSSQVNLRKSSHQDFNSKSLEKFGPASVVNESF